MVSAPKQAFAGTERDWDYHEFHLINEVICKKRLKKVCASHYVDIGSVLLLESPYFFHDVAAEEYVGLPIARVSRV